MDKGRSDEELVLAAKRGSREAFGILLARHRPLLLGVCRRALRDDGLAEDASQEAALQALLSLDRLRRPERFASWLAGIGLNLCHRLRRQLSRDAWSLEAMLGGSLISEPTDPATEPEDLAEAAELRAWIAHAVNGLPPGQRTAVILHYLSGLTQAETAAVLGIEVGAVKTRLYKARANLRRDLVSNAGEADSVVTKGERTMVEMRLTDVRRRLPDDGTTPRHIVILEEVDGPRRLTIWIGEAEAISLSLELENVPQPRPLTYAFAANVLQAANGLLREVRIDRLEGEVFFASAVIDGPSGQREVDARPSDALNLALLLSTPIRVHPNVLDTGGGVRSDEEWIQLTEKSEGPAAIAAAVIADWVLLRPAKAD